MKRFIILALLFALMLPVNSCSIFKNRSVQKASEKTSVKENVTVSKETKDSVATLDKGITEERSKVLSEEITIKKGSPIKPIELTATFRVDTAASMTGDTALKLVDIHNEDISVAIYQNKRTNEMMAKVSTGKGSQSIPFSELQIKRNYSETSKAVDTSKSKVATAEKKVDSTANKADVREAVTKNSNSGVSTKGVLGIVGIVAIIGVIVAIYFLIKNGKIKNIFKGKE